MIKPKTSKRDFSAIVPDRSPSERGRNVSLSLFGLRLLLDAGIPVAAAQGAKRFLTRVLMTAVSSKL